MKLEIPDTIAQAAGLDEKEMLTLLALALYSQKKLSPGHAGALLGLSRLEFYDLMAEFNIPWNYDVQDLKDDMKALNRLDEKGFFSHLDAKADDDDT